MPGPCPQEGEKEPSKTYKQGQALTRDALRERVMSAESPRKEMQKVIDEVAVAAGHIQAHGMPEKEFMSGMKIDGVTVQWGEKTTGVANSLVNMLGTPAGLWNANKEVIFSTQKSQEDEHWAKTYNMASFTSKATGGDGRIVFYSGRQADPETFAHESGHNLATKTFGTVTPTASSAYGKAQKAEGPVSSYAKNSKAEDFAEAARLYATDAPKLQASSPQKYAAIKELISGK